MLLSWLLIFIFLKLIIRVGIGIVGYDVSTSELKSLIYIIIVYLSSRLRRLQNKVLYGLIP